MGKGSNSRIKRDGPKSAAGSSNISIVLVEPRGSGNVGSVARAMKNTGLSDLVLVNPCDYLNNEAYSMACKADDVLRAARVYPTLDECVKTTGVLVGATRRMGRLRYPVLTLDEAVPRIIELARTNRVSILFGREDRGLLNSEIKQCDILFEIPTSGAYPSLNLSVAVMLVCHHIFTAQGAKGPTVEVAPRE
ncbi:MAG: RNA methyltransferase, partial [Thermodesulfobacteriota bacterium]